MADLAERPDEDVLVGAEFTDKTADGVQSFVRQTYKPPLDGSKDDYAHFDNHLANGIIRLLCGLYPGYNWYVKTESAQGIVAFSIPSLMGPTLMQVIRLAEYKDLTPELIQKTAGEMLERMGLKRGRADRAQVREAMQRRHTFQFSDVKGSK